MKKILCAYLSVLVCMAVLLFSFLAYAQVNGINPDQNLAELIRFLVQAFQAGNWFVVGGIVVMLLVWGISKYLPDTKYLTLISAGIGMLGGLITGFMDGTKPWYVSMYFGLMTGGAASQFWGLFGKTFLPKLVSNEEKNSSIVDEKKS
jgi:hypothetical protein